MDPLKLETPEDVLARVRAEQPKLPRLVVVLREGDRDRLAAFLSRHLGDSPLMGVSILYTDALQPDRAILVADDREGPVQITTFRLDEETSELGE